MIQAIAKADKEKKKFPFFEKDMAMRYVGYNCSVSRVYRYLAYTLLVLDKSEFIIEVAVAKLKGKNTKEHMHAVVFVELAR